MSSSPNAHLPIAALIVAAGRGSRMGNSGSLPKQYLDLGGRTVLERTVRAFLDHERIAMVQVVIHPDDHELCARALGQHPRLLSPVPGGATRQESVFLGLKALARHAPGSVLIHDAARPFVGSHVIGAVIDAIRPGRGALPGIPVADTLKKADAGPDGLPVVEGTVARDGLFSAQTPQGFILAEILAAHEAAAANGENSLTDDAAIAERAGMKVLLVPGDPANTKITTASDLDEARKRQGMMIPDIRSGTGYDVHRTIQGNCVTLCGVMIKSDISLDGHSDADVGLHALTDAVLGTFGAGDIGSHFPPSDPQWKGASSDRFLAHAVALARAAGGRITNLDVSLICERPKIGPHRDAMRERIAGICGVEPFRVSVKATTNEGVGFVGRGEGIAAIATATLVFGT